MDASVKSKRANNSSGQPGILIADDEQLRDTPPSIETDYSAYETAPVNEAHPVENGIAQVIAEMERVQNLHNAFNAIFEQTRGRVVAESQPERARHLEKLSNVFPTLIDNKVELVLKNDKAAIIVVPNKISFVAMADEKGHGDVKKSFDADSAYAMAIIASQNEKMLEKGIKLSGTKEQQQLLRTAVARVNAELPPGQQLRIRDEARPAVALNLAAEQKAAPAPAPQAKAPVAAQPKSQPKTQAADATPAQPERKVVEAPVPFFVPVSKPKAAEQPNEQPVDLGRRRLFGAGRQAESKVVPLTEAPAKTVATKPDSVEAVPSQSGQRSAMSRRSILTGLAGVAAAATVLTPDSAQAASRKPQNLFEAIFGVRDEAPEHAPVPEANPRRAKQGRRHKSHGEQHAEGGRRKKKHRQAQDEHHEKPRAGKHNRKAHAEHAEKPNKRLKRQYQEAADEQPAQTMRGQPTSGSVRLVNAHTGERFTLDFGSVNPKVCSAGEFRQCCNQFNHFARDWRQNEAVSMDPKLMQFMAQVVTNLRSKGYAANEVSYLCGYRSPETNRMLQKTQGGQASNSQHLYGRATDWAIPGVSTSALHKACCEVVGGHGGVGKYTKSGFVHIDTRGYGARWGA